MRSAAPIRPARCAAACTLARALTFALAIAGATIAVPAAAAAPGADVARFAAADQSEAASGTRSAARSSARSRPGSRSRAAAGNQAASAPAAAVEAALYVPTGPDQLPSHAQMLVLIRSTLSALDQANSTGYYFVFAGLASEPFRRTNAPSAVGQAFEGYRAKGVSFSPVLVLDPVFSQPPAVRDGELRMTGYFPSQPDQIGFDLRYRYERSQWRLSGIDMQMLHTPGQGEPAAPVEPPRGPALPGR